MKLLIAAAACLVATSSFADTYKREVPANKGGYVDGVGFYDRSTCSAEAMPRVKINKEPKHGKLILRPSTGPINRDNTICKGKNINVMYIYYQPEKGYRGPDEARISYSIMTSGRTRGGRGSNSYKITVK
ncbi:hypothetical protein PsAD13_05083 [Pseudovibrio sp. Ad13]|uniref:hypothetical protein n=1 Tax=unclassified Pseudovibrio TaxID=2627060 RepID=UPI0007AEC3FF|nr:MULTISPECIES: hypothetical protein [unclassified Pseudovibrio]KZK79240.1 hypothetical protein PsAD13_05083 [Pseudovibrio sp. Ad13]